MKARAEAKKAKKKRKIDDDEVLKHRGDYSDIAFGERAHAPPELSIRPSVNLFLFRASVTLLCRHRKDRVDKVDSKLLPACTMRRMSAKMSTGADLSKFECVVVICVDSMTRALYYHRRAARDQFSSHLLSLARWERSC